MLRSCRRVAAAALQRQVHCNCSRSYSSAWLSRWTSSGDQGQERSGIAGAAGFLGLVGLGSWLVYAGAGSSAHCSSEQHDGVHGERHHGMLGMDFKRRTFFNYEKRIRERSTPEKVFEYFSSVQRDGTRYMTPGDLLRALVAVYPPEGSNIERAGSLPGEREPSIPNSSTGANILKEIDVDGDGLISYPEYLLLLTLLSIPVQDVATVMKVVDVDGNGTVDLAEFNVILEALQNKLKLHSKSFRYSSHAGGMLQSFFGKDLDRPMTLQHLLSFLQRLQHDIVTLEFEYYDYRGTGLLTATDFAHSLVTAAGPMQVNKLLDKVAAMPAPLRSVAITRQEWLAVAGMRAQLHTLEVALHFLDQLHGRVTKQNLHAVLRSVLGITLRGAVLDVIEYVFGDGSGALDVGLMLDVLGKHCLTLTAK